MRLKKKGFLLAGAAAAVIALLCLWYTRPRTWVEITGDDAEVLFASLTMADPDWEAETAEEKLGYLHWQLRQEDPGFDEAAGAILQALEQRTFRASLDSLIPREQISLGWSDDITAAITWGEGNRQFFYFGESGKMISHNGWGYDIYYCDPALFYELVEIVRTYGVPEEATG